jgi:propionyl-CoA synthetase
MFFFDPAHIVYAPLLRGSTSVLYEGKPVGTPDPGQFWRMIDQHKVISITSVP